MATTQEEARIRFGVDAAGVDVGTDAMLAKQGEAAIKFQSIWARAATRAAEAQTASLKMWNEAMAKALADQLAMEREKNTASIAMARATAVEKAAINRTWMEEQAAQSAIGGGSGAFGSLEAGAAGGLAGKGLREVNHEAHGFAGILRESAVLVREGLRGNFTRMIGSASILAGLISSFGIVVLAATAAIVGLPAYRTYQAIKNRNESGKELSGKEHDYSESLRSQIDEMQRVGVFDKGHADGLREQLQNGGYSDLISVSKIVRDNASKVGPAQRIKKADDDYAREQKQLDEINQKQEKGATLESSIADKREKILFLQNELNVVDKSSVEFHEARARLVEYELELNKDLTNQKQQQDAQDKATSEWKKWSANAGLQYMRDQIGASQEGAEYLSLSDLAGRRRTQRLDRAYGRGGRYDLGRGGGPFADIAYDAELAQKQQLWNRKYGNMGAAEQDRLRYNADVTQLVDAGAASPQQLLSKIEGHAAELSALWKTCIASGAVKASVIGTE